MSESERDHQKCLDDSKGIWDFQFDETTKQFSIDGYSLTGNYCPICGEEL